MFRSRAKFNERKPIATNPAVTPDIKASALPPNPNTAYFKLFQCGFNNFAPSAETTYESCEPEFRELMNFKCKPST